MAYKYQPIKDEIFASDGEGGDEDVEDNDALEEGEHILSTIDGDGNLEAVAGLPPNAKVKQVIEQDGVLILETVDDPDGLHEGTAILADTNGLPDGTAIAIADGNGLHEGTAILADGNGLPEGTAILTDANGHELPEGTTILADGNGLPPGATILADGNETFTSTGDSSLDDSAILAELEDVNADIKPSTTGAKESCHICGKKVAHLDKHILAEHGEKVECQLCNQTFPVGNLRWHILKEHCHNKVN